MIEIEKQNCIDGNDARKRERYWYEMLNADLNSINPYKSEKETKEYIRSYNKNYKQSPKGKENNQMYYLQHFEHLKQKSNTYYLKNKENISITRSIQILCECGCSISKGNYSTHIKTKKHLDKLSTIQYIYDQTY